MDRPSGVKGMAQTAFTGLLASKLVGKGGGSRTGKGHYYK